MNADREQRPMLYYVPTPKKMITAGDYEGFGLGHLKGTNPMSREITCGPEGAGPGILVMPELEALSGLERIAAEEAGPGASGTCMDISPETHKWTKCNGGKFWVTWAIGKPPGPLDLARLDGLGGEACVMGDGNKWTIPAASNIPLAYCLDDNGDFGLGKDKNYAGLDEAILALQEYIFGATIDREEFVRHIVAGLAVNYRIGFYEALALMLVTDRSGEEAAGIMTNRELVFKLMKEQQTAEKKSDGSEAPA